MKRLKVPKRIQEALNGATNYRLKRGKRHIRIFVNDRFVGIAPHCVSGDGHSDGYGQDNVIAQIKRARKVSG